MCWEERCYSNLCSEIHYFSEATSKQVNQSESDNATAEACMLIQLILLVVFALYNHIIQDNP